MASTLGLSLQVQQSALAFISKTWRGRQNALVRQFGMALKKRAQASLAAKLAISSAVQA